MTAGSTSVRFPLMDQDSETGLFTPHTYHVHIRFEMGFTQPHELADAIMQAVHRGKRVVVEHFDLIYPFLSTNANLLIGVGDQILVARPNPFGPFPDSISRKCQESLKYRLMAHTAEDLCEFCIPPEERDRAEHDDIHHGFILAFPEYKPELDLADLERRMLELTDQDQPVDYVDESHIAIGGKLHPLHRSPDPRPFHRPCGGVPSGEAVFAGSLQQAVFAGGLRGRGLPGDDEPPEPDAGRFGFYISVTVVCSRQTIPCRINGRMGLLSGREFWYIWIQAGRDSASTSSVTASVSIS